ncbi:uncharacterized protein LOC131677911 isoform X2 [Topomyia yanbarensis]|uniref:uncharacterized protein LOC131677911 isoform X2 n=1 Tax=Topomyia yanbarensis TaxID=2498891 RepID=UPI00273C5B84|nr:uncharacterized protein LOC131677911 isoform X2 [Topomyia yanbarensis]
MSKRCCAASCYNSVTTNRNVEYFGFPKNAKYATAWAQAAGREDLLEKSLNNIIKYFLCSEHFSDECFQDSPHNRKLKKTSRPVVVPIPTIFQNNFVECVSKSLKEDRCTLVLDNERESCAVGHKKYSQENNFERLTVEDTSHESTKVEKPLLAADNDIVSNTLEAEIIQSDVIDEEHIMCLVDTVSEVSETPYDSQIFGLVNCRLCLSAKENELLIPIFGNGSEIAYMLERILPDTVRNANNRLKLRQIVKCHHALCFITIFSIAN